MTFVASEVFEVQVEVDATLVQRYASGAAAPCLRNVHGHVRETLPELARMSYLGAGKGVVSAS